MQATIELLSEFDAELAASVRGVANLRTKEYKQQLAAEGYPADFTRRSYMRYQIKKLLVTDVEWQFEALSQVRWHAYACVKVPEEMALLILHLTRQCAVDAWCNLFEKCCASPAGCRVRYHH